MRQVVPFTVQPTMDDDEIGAAIAAGAQSGRLWRSGWAKFFIDGVVESGTAWLEQPDTQGRGTEPNWPDPERYAAVIARFAEAGMPSITHAIGDRSVRCALDAYRRAGRWRAGRTASSTSRRCRTTSCRGSPPERVVASQQVSHLQWMTPGPVRSLEQVAGRRSAAAAGSGRPSCGARARCWRLDPTGRWRGFDPRECMAWARLRRRPGSRDARGYGDRRSG